MRSEAIRNAQEAHDAFMAVCTGLHEQDVSWETLAAANHVKHTTLYKWVKEGHTVR
jgi:hypothetical protein